MTRTYAACRLLEHGPLEFREVLAITGWKKSHAWYALAKLRRSGVVRLLNIDGRRHHALA